jgi:hypothetical protein
MAQFEVSAAGARLAVPLMVRPDHAAGGGPGTGGRVMAHTMTERVRPRDASASSELEQIVAGLFDAMEQEVARPRAYERNADVDQGSQGGPEAAAADEDQPEAAGMPKAQDTEALGSEGVAAGDPDAQPDARRPEIGLGSADRAKAPASEAEIFTIDHARPIQRPVDILLPEEEAFIAKTVAWLTGRPNPDIVLEQIWSMLVALREAEEEATMGSDFADTAAASGGPG